jgi:hypothetical protein
MIGQTVDAGAHFKKRAAIPLVPCTYNLLGQFLYLFAVISLAKKAPPTYTVKKGSRVSRPQPGCHYQTLPGRE